MAAISEILARELGCAQAYVENIITLLDEGNTIPFIARYRKEQHGSMDDTTLRKLEDRLTYLRSLDQRRQEVKKAVDGQGKLTPELSAAIDAAATLAEVRDGKIGMLPQKLKLFGEEKAAAQLGIGLPTLQDIVRELTRPGRDVRDDLPAPVLRTDVLDIKDLKPGMTLTGTVRNVVDFGVFVDIGVHQDGLVHISQVCSKFIKHPSEVVAVGDVVPVVVLDVDEKKHRISLSMKQAAKK